MITDNRRKTVRIENGNSTHKGFWYNDFVGSTFSVFPGKIRLGAEYHDCYFFRPDLDGSFILACDATVVAHPENVSPVGSTLDENRDTPSDEPPRPFNPGDKVVSLRRGQGEVVSAGPLTEGGAYFVTVRFDGRSEPLRFAQSGKEYKTDACRTLFHVDERPQVTTVPLPPPPIEKGALVWAWDGDSGEDSPTLAIYVGKDGPFHRVRTRLNPTFDFLRAFVLPYQPEKTDD